jgi:predicted GH43/DUF377 family glycosyl hydrolase
MAFRHPYRDVGQSDRRTPVEGAAEKLLTPSPRPGYFDSWLVEAGPPALVTRHGILVVYNAGNSEDFGDTQLPSRVYTGGQALFDARNPMKLLERSNAPFIKPTEAYERTGQYVEGTTFTEALVPSRAVAFTLWTSRLKVEWRFDPRKP